MQIQGVSNQQTWQLFKSKQDSPRNEAEKTKNAQKNTVTDVATQTAEVSKGKPEEKGVVRLLAEGHFIGAADIRLRINFQEELQELVSREAGVAMESEGQNLVSALETKIKDLGIDSKFPDEMPRIMQDFENAISATITGTKEGTIAPNSALTEIKGAFGDLLTALKDLAPAPEANPAVSETAAIASTDVLLAGQEPMVSVASEVPKESVGTSETTSDPLTSDLDILQGLFELKMTSLTQMVADSSSLPPLSDARGNGKAYERFLESYNALYATTETANNTQPEGLQTVA